MNADGRGYGKNGNGISWKDMKKEKSISHKEAQKSTKIFDIKLLLRGYTVSFFVFLRLFVAKSRFFMSFMLFMVKKVVAVLCALLLRLDLFSLRV